MDILQGQALGSPCLEGLATPLLVQVTLPLVDFLLTEVGVVLSDIACKPPSSPTLPSLPPSCPTLPSLLPHPPLPPSCPTLPSLPPAPPSPYSTPAACPELCC